ncbi:YHS domain-containing (seleno)protein [Maritalea mediterranea]|uniref:Tat pathway signal sequence domain protein n=1 Tax=Maritalea mediterranea TaxID=2909667 RepID=A0ABS9E7P0_9HYPH|nr:YHS domain-containing (seleno)protein [Maritalea mediterranea]MCF4098900.1 tat pathway signal sequence domain protein [Maritalea mediterranea]
MDRRVFIGLALIGASGLAVYPAMAQTGRIYTGLVPDTAVGGYDSVTYFTEGQAIKGSPDITLDYGGAIWRFASVENRDMYAADPERYAPQYGGHCAYAAAKGYLAKGDPEVWHIENGKLYLNFDQNVQKLWFADIPGFIKQADANWPTLGR